MMRGRVRSLDSFFLYYCIHELFYIFAIEGLLQLLPEVCPLEKFFDFFMDWIVYIDDNGDDYV